MPRSGGGLGPIGAVASRKKNPTIAQIQTSNVWMKNEILIRYYVKGSGHIQIRGNATAVFLRNWRIPWLISVTLAGFWDQTWILRNLKKCHPRCACRNYIRWSDPTPFTHRGTHIPREKNDTKVTPWRYFTPAEDRGVTRATYSFWLLTLLFSPIANRHCMTETDVEISTS